MGSPTHVFWGGGEVHVHLLDVVRDLRPELVHDVVEFVEGVHLQLGLRFFQQRQQAAGRREPRRCSHVVVVVEGDLGFWVSKEGGCVSWLWPSSALRGVDKKTREKRRKKKERENVGMLSMYTVALVRAAAR